ncbi:Asp-tRNA(Asn)/Glu-tRNA(Gln) amidotransferase subunit GatC [Candidatus Microgenomates bacterium]|nr:Asp-tRNA(Asn)/Glu-tRNA(Gln) amidotransferase subunit GatC [Candidatus Microgenomates bacterium]
MKLSIDEVNHVAKLANLKLTPKELKKFQKQLSSILEYVNQLKELDTKNVEPTSQVTGLENVFREDEVKPSMSQEESLSNAKETHNGFFKVKAIF